MRKLSHMGEALSISINLHVYSDVVVLLTLFTYFLFLFQFRITNTDLHTKFFKIKCIFLRNNYKNTPI